MAMQSMREGMKSVMWIVALAFVASLFFVGVNTLRKLIGGEGGPAVVVVDGKRVGTEEFNAVYDRELRLRAKGARRITVLVVKSEHEAIAFWQVIGYDHDQRMLRYVKTLD